MTGQWGRALVGPRVSVTVIVGLPRRLRDRGLTVSGRDELDQQIDEGRRLRRAEPGRRIPTRRGIETRYAGKRVVAHGHVVERGSGVRRRVADVIKRFVDEAQIGSLLLI